MRVYELRNIGMSKNIIKYTGRIVWGLITVYLGLITIVTLFPDESYHHCEAGQEEMSPWWGVLITILSLVIFCYVWYKTNDKTIVDSDTNSPSEDLPEPYKSYLDFDQYLSNVKWIDIKNEEELTPMSGLYLFNCRGDNHSFFEVHELDKGEKLCKHYLVHHFDGWAVVKPVRCHYVEDDKKEFVLEGVKRLGL